MLKDASYRIHDYGRIEAIVGPETDTQFQFTGIKKKNVNTYTLTSRMNHVQTTYAGFALVILYFKCRSKRVADVKATFTESNLSLLHPLCSQP
nr:ATP synthase membrane subunit K, mitochondrial-like [Delphinus delphis]